MSMEIAKKKSSDVMGRVNKMAVVGEMLVTYSTWVSVNFSMEVVRTASAGTVRAGWGEGICMRRFVWEICMGERKRAGPSTGVKHANGQ